MNSFESFTSIDQLESFIKQELTKLDKQGGKHKLPLIDPTNVLALITSDFPLAVNKLAGSKLDEDISRKLNQAALLRLSYLS